MNNHFVPQFLLRNFCKDEKIQYYDIKISNHAECPRYACSKEISDNNNAKGQR